MLSLQTPEKNRSCLFQLLLLPAMLGLQPHRVSLCFVSLLSPLGPLPVWIYVSPPLLKGT